MYSFTLLPKKFIGIVLLLLRYIIVISFFSPLWTFNILASSSDTLIPGTLSYTTLKIVSLTYTTSPLSYDLNLKFVK
jgi:hypothetical protein